MQKLNTMLGLCTIFLLVQSCTEKADFNYYYYTKEESQVLNEYLNLPAFPPPYEVNLPDHLKRSGLSPRPVNRDKATLGRVLFYDKNLSADGTVACADCHKQALGFADNVAFSRGVEGRSTARNSFALSSVANFSAYYGTDLNGATAIRFFWDNRAETVADQSRGSLTNSREMNMGMQDVVNQVISQPYYEPLFKKAYGHFSVNENLVLESIANFINSLGSYQSKFDQAADNDNSIIEITNNAFVYKKDFTGFTREENEGKRLFNSYCASCHSGNMGRPVLQFANNGLDLNTAADEGVGAISGLPEQKGTFKVPTLRNIALTAPYMHDGRFKTLDEVLEHYNSGIKDHPNLHPYLRDLTGDPLRNFLNAEKKQQLIAFLNTLTDENLLHNEFYSDPFKY